MLSKEELNEYYSYQRRIDEAFAARNEKDLNLLKNQFKDFRSSADKSIQAAKQKMLDDWVKNADLGSAIGGLLTLGAVRTTTTVSGHKITMSTQYQTDFGVSDEQIKNSMDSYLSWMSSSLQSGVNALGYYINDICFRIEYKNVNGKVVGEKEFKVTKATTPAGFNPPDKYYPKQEADKTADAGNGKQTEPGSTTITNAPVTQSTTTSSVTPPPTATTTHVASTIESGFEVEDNNSLSKANEILLNETYSGMLSADYSIEQDWYTFEIETDSVVVLHFSSVTQENPGTFWDMSLRSGESRDTILWQRYITGSEPEVESKEINLHAGRYYIEIESSDMHSSDLYSFDISRCSHQSVPFTETSVVKKEGCQIQAEALTSLGETWCQCLSIGPNSSYDYGFIEVLVPQDSITLELTIAPPKGLNDDTIFVVEVFGNDESNVLYETDGITYKTKNIVLDIDVREYEIIRIKASPTRLNIITRYESVLINGVFHKDSNYEVKGLEIKESSHIVRVTDVPVLSSKGCKALSSAMDIYGKAWGECISLSGSNTGYIECYIGGSYGILDIMIVPEETVHSDTLFLVTVYGNDESDVLFTSEKIHAKSGTISFSVDVSNRDYIRIEVKNTNQHVVNSNDKLLLRTNLQ